MRKYHYTVGNYIPQIIKSGEIQLATEFTFKKREYAVWTSTNPVWENTCNKQFAVSRLQNGGISYKDYFRMRDSRQIISLDMEWTHKLCGGLCRIEVEPKSTPFTIGNYCRLAKMNKSFSKKFIRAGIDMGANPKEWFAGFKPIPSEKWIAIEMFDWDTQTWIPYVEGVIPSGVDIEMRWTRGKIQNDETTESLLQGMIDGLYDPDEVFAKIMR